MRRSPEQLWRQIITIIGWDVQDAPTRSYLFPDDSKDANPNPETAGADKDEYWLTTGESPVEAPIKRIPDGESGRRLLWSGRYSQLS